MKTYYEGRSYNPFPSSTRTLVTKFVDEEKEYERRKRLRLLKIALVVGTIAVISILV